MIPIVEWKIATVDFTRHIQRLLYCKHRNFFSYSPTFEIENEPYCCHDYMHAFMLLHVWKIYIQERAEGTFYFTAVMCVMQGMHVLVMSIHYLG